MKIILRLLVFGVPLVLTGTGCSAGQVVAALSEKAQRSADAQRKVILAEIATLKDHQWAGDYYKGDGLGVNVSFAIAPRSGYVFEWHGCLGLYGLNYGSMVCTNGRITLSFTYRNADGFAGISPELIPVSWESRHYLVPANDVVGFCNAVNHGLEPRAVAYGSYLLRRGDEKNEATGVPNVPEQYRAYLLARPIEAVITAVGHYTTRPSITTSKFKHTPVTLNAGSKSGLLVGMELVVTKPETIVESVLLTIVSTDQAEGIMVQAGEREPGPKVGWRLSTRSPWSLGASDAQ